MVARASPAIANRIAKNLVLVMIISPVLGLALPPSVTPLFESDSALQFCLA
jgi:hypothetical protein